MTAERQQRNGETEMSLIALFLIDQLADARSTLSRCLRTSDVFCVRRTCKEAWTRLTHKTLTKGNIVSIALDRQALGNAVPHIPLLSWCFRNRAHIELQHVGYIAQTGVPAFVDELKSRFPDDWYTILVGLAAGGHEELVLQLLADPATFAAARELFGTTARALADGGMVEAARLVEPDVSRWSVLPVFAALERGHLDFAKWALDGYSWTADDKHMMYAAGGGSIELLDWLALEGCPVHGDAPQFAASHGHIHVLKWLMARGLPVDDHCLALAVSGGHLDVVVWLVERGCALSGTLTSNSLMYRAALHQGPAMVQLLAHLGCPYDEEDLLSNACANVCGDSLFRWLIDQGYHCDVQRCLETVERKPRFDAALITDPHGLPLPHHYLTSAVVSKDIDRLRRAIQDGQTANIADVRLLVERNQVAMLAELLQHGRISGDISSVVQIVQDDSPIQQLFSVHGYNKANHGNGSKERPNISHRKSNAQTPTIL